jgi:hypothetical protein
MTERKATTKAKARTKAKATTKANTGVLQLRGFAASLRMTAV